MFLGYDVLYNGGPFALVWLVGNGELNKTKRRFHHAVNNVKVSEVCERLQDYLPDHSELDGRHCELKKFSILLNGLSIIHCAQVEILLKNITGLYIRLHQGSVINSNPKTRRILVKGVRYTNDLVLQPLPKENAQGLEWIEATIYKYAQDVFVEQDVDLDEEDPDSQELDAPKGPRRGTMHHTVELPSTNIGFVSPPPNGESNVYEEAMDVEKSRGEKSRRRRKRRLDDDRLPGEIDLLQMLTCRAEPDPRAHTMIEADMPPMIEQEMGFYDFTNVAPGTDLDQLINGFGGPFADMQGPEKEGELSVPIPENFDEVVEQQAEIVPVIAVLPPAPVEADETREGIPPVNMRPGEGEVEPDSSFTLAPLATDVSNKDGLERVIPVENRKRKNKKFQVADNTTIIPFPDELISYTRGRLLGTTTYVDEVKAAVCKENPYAFQPIRKPKKPKIDINEPPWRWVGTKLREMTKLALADAAAYQGGVKGLSIPRRLNFSVEVARNQSGESVIGYEELVIPAERSVGTSTSALETVSEIEPNGVVLIGPSRRVDVGVLPVGPGTPPRHNAPGNGAEMEYNANEHNGGLGHFEVEIEAFPSPTGGAHRIEMTTDSPQEEASPGAPPPTTGGMRFDEMVPKDNSRRHAARVFAKVLKLQQKKELLLTQYEFYGPITVSLLK